MAEVLGTRRDLAALDVRRDAVAELERAQDRGDDAALLAWAKRWGPSVRQHLIDDRTREFVDDLGEDFE